MFRFTLVFTCILTNFFPLAQSHKSPKDILKNRHETSLDRETTVNLIIRDMELLRIGPKYSKEDRENLKNILNETLGLLEIYERKEEQAPDEKVKKNLELDFYVQFAPMFERLHRYLPEEHRNHIKNQLMTKT